MMDKKSANGFQTKASEGGVQRKQLPYSVETPYGFHLDLDFLKYVDDIEKGNTIKRVHIQRRVKGPAKFSTLPRNFSLPGHGARPTPREKDSTWSGTSTLGPKPKSRVTEVQQIYDFRASEGGKPSQSSRGTSSQGAVYVSEKPKDESGAGALAVEEKTVGFQSRPNLLRASSMPITLQQRKGSDSSSPDRNVGTPESGSTENMFRASPDITDRRSLPQDRGGLHQQITVALKRVRELEEQVKTIPELKAQISSLRKEREDLMIQIHAQIQAQAQAEAQMVAEAAAVSPPRPRANSIERGTVTERIATQDQMTETPTAERVNQVTETEEEIETNHPQRPSASSVERGTVTESVDTVDRVTETVEAQRTDQQTETEIGRRQDNNPSRGAEAESQVAPEILEEKQIKEHVIVSATIKETVVTDTVVVVAAAENEAVKAVVPVRPQRGRRPSAEQAQPSPPSPPQPQAAPVCPSRGSSETLAQESQTKDPPQVEDQSPAEKPPGESSEKQSESQPQIETQGPSPGSTDVQTHPKSIKAQPKTSAARRDTKEPKAPRGSGEVHTRPTRQGSSTAKPQSQGSRRSSSETQPPHKDVSETQSLRRGSNETAQRRNSSEAQALRRDAGEAETSRRGSGESPTSPAALGHVVTRLTGLLGEQWAQLGSSTGTQQTASQQESPSTQKQTPGKKTEAAKGAKTKPAGKAVPAATTAKPGGKPGPSKMSSIQSQLVSSLSVLSAFYSPGQKAAAASKQQEQGLKSIMKKNGVADKQGNKGAKKNLKFVGVNGGYESTSSEESSGDEKTKVEVEEQDSSEPEVEKEKETEPQPEEKPEEGAETQQQEAEVAPEGGGAVAAEKEAEKGLLDPEGSEELLGEQEEGEKVEQSFIDACLYVKDRMEEVSSPDKEMRQVLVVLYQEWFKISSQKDSQADTVRLYLRQVGLTTPTLLPYVVNLTDGNGNMALHYSVSHSNFPVVKLLLDTGLCETNNVNKAGYTPVMLAALTAAESPDDLEVAQQLLRQGDVNACSRQAGQTALMLAVSHGRVAMVKLLLICGTDVNAQDREGSTALMCASEHGHTNIVRMLLETGRCDISLIDKNRQSALSVAEAASHQEIVHLLKTHAETRASEPSTNADLL
ncbi:hypothetical protein NQZ68_004781 [Dissostichus eleginoides]|nr:hypothetical protein NQZ68_004781 [Dissostichus eleginoides]